VQVGEKAVTLAKLTEIWWIVSVEKTANGWDFGKIKSAEISKPISELRAKMSARDKHQPFVEINFTSSELTRLAKRVQGRTFKGIGEENSKNSKNGIILISFDGGCRGNPGPSGSAAVLKPPEGEPTIISRFIQSATNNEAEYQGAIIGLKKALEMGYKRAVLIGDSQLVINQLMGIWGVHKEHLSVLWNEAISLINQFESIQMWWIPRAENGEADAAANEVMDRNMGVTAIRKKAATLPVVEPSSALADQINRLIESGTQARFKEFINLKSGRDEFTALKFTVLKERLPIAVVESIDSAMPDTDQSTLAKVYRWYLRGLPVDLAIQKVKIDREVSEKIIAAKRR
jgi:ribonuclease HI